MNNRPPSLNDAFPDDEKTFLSGGALDLQALANASPLLKAGLFLLVTALTFTTVWVLWLGVSWGDLERLQEEETRLNEVLAFQQLKASKLEPLKAQQFQVLQAIESMEMAFSRKGEMAELLKDINRAGLVRGLQFELFRPEKEVMSAHYAELPISLRVTGRYHQLGVFAADIARLPRLVTLDSLVITPLKEGNLTLEATLHAYRHLELEEQRLLKKPAAVQGDKP